MDQIPQARRACFQSVPFFPAQGRQPGNRVFDAVWQGRSASLNLGTSRKGAAESISVSAG
jgi:hypothetical protein